MKRRKIVIAAGILFLALSCTKARICTCTTVHSNGSTSVNNQLIGDNSFPGPPSTKKNEETKCKSKEGSSDEYTRTCALQN